MLSFDNFEVQRIFFHGTMLIVGQLGHHITSAQSQGLRGGILYSFQSQYDLRRRDEMESKLLIKENHATLLRRESRLSVRSLESAIGKALDRPSTPCPDQANKNIVKNQQFWTNSVRLPTPYGTDRIHEVW